MPINTNRTKSGSATPSYVTVGASSFTPAAITRTDLVDIVGLARKASSRDSILQTDANGKIRQQVLIDIVGIALPVLDEHGNQMLDDKGNVIKQCYPDHTGRYKLPDPESEAFEKLMNRPSGIIVKSIMNKGIEKLRGLVTKNFLPGITLEAFNKAVNDGSLMTLLGTRGAFLSSIDGIYEEIEWTLGEIMGGGTKTVSISFFGEEGSVFEESFEDLQQKHIRFQNIAFAMKVSPVLYATQLKSNISYQADETHFYYTNNDGKTKYMLDPKAAFSGKVYGVQTVAVNDARALAEVGTTLQYNRNRDAINQGSAQREYNRDKIARDLATSYLPDPTLVPMSGIDMV